MSEFFKVSGIEGFNGLVFEAQKDADSDVVFPVVSILNPHQIVGDRILKIPMPDHALYLNNLSPHFTPTDDPQKEFTTKNPFGPLLFQGGYRKETIEIVYARYDNGISVTILEHYGELRNPQFRTIYTQNFFKQADTALEKIEDVLSGDVDVEDLVFMLKNLEAEDK